MKRHVTFPDIAQFRSAVHNVKHKTSYQGKDALGNIIHDYTTPNPVLSYEGTVKLHGTNASIIYDGSEMWVQSRENIIEVGKDNAGFAMWVQANKEILLDVFRAINLPNETCAIFGE